ncbi:MAG: hypothetical protein V3W41_02545 [Planctomycetota bacterium]
MRQTHISILGTFDGEYDGHVATRDAIIHAERALGVVINTRWITPDELSNPAESLADSCGVLIACRNPKHLRRLMPDVLASLTFAREKQLPTLGIEGGFQHMLIEYARVVAGHPEANSTAYDEDSFYPLLTRLAPDLVGEKPREEPCAIKLSAGSRLREFYDGQEQITESYRSHYGLNADYMAELEAAGLAFSAEGEAFDRRFVAGFELPSLAFFVGVAFLPQHGSKKEHGHPLFRAFVESALKRR